MIHQVKYPSDNMSTDQMLRLSAKYIKTVGTKYYCDLCYSEHNSKIVSNRSCTHCIPTYTTSSTQPDTSRSLTVTRAHETYLHCL